MIVLKLGGSLITSKSSEFSIRMDVLSRVAEEIRMGMRDRLIIVHGGGSFGHPLAEKYMLNKGYIHRSQRDGVVLTRLAMQTLNSQVVGAMVNVQLPATGISTSSMFITQDREIVDYNREIIHEMLNLGTVPVLYGDVVIDRKLGFCILSGDAIVRRLATDFKASRIIFATDVDGIFTADPKKDKNAKLIEEITPENFQEVLSSIEPVKGDVTGGMENKLRELITLAEEGYSSIIINAMVEGRLQKALLGEKVKGTVIRK